MSDKPTLLIDNNFLQQLYRIGGIDLWNTLFSKHNRVLITETVYQEILLHADTNTGFLKDYQDAFISWFDESDPKFEKVTTPRLALANAHFSP